MECCSKKIPLLSSKPLSLSLAVDVVRAEFSQLPVMLQRSEVRFCFSYRVFLFVCVCVVMRLVSHRVMERRLPALLWTKSSRRWHCPLPLLPLRRRSFGSKAMGPWHFAKILAPLTNSGRFPSTARKTTPRCIVRSTRPNPSMRKRTAVLPLSTRLSVRSVWRMLLCRNASV